METTDIATPTGQPINDEMVEEIARRICAFHGIDPDAKEYHQKGDFGRVMSYYGTQWHRFREQAAAGLIAAIYVRERHLEP